MTAMNRGVIFAAFLALIPILASCATTASLPPVPTSAPTSEPTATPTSEPTAAPTSEPTTAPTSEAQSTATETQTSKLTLASAGGEDNRHPLGAAIGAAVTKTNSNLEISVKNTSSMMENLKLLLNWKVDMAFSYDYHIVLANQGNLTKAFPDAPPETIHIKCGVEVVRPAFSDYSQPARILSPLYEQPLHFVTIADGEIATISDLEGKRISAGVPGTVTEELAVYLLEALGIDLEKNISLEYLSASESAAALEKGELDGFFWNGPVPNADIANLFAASTVEMAIIPIAGEDAAQIMRTHPGIFHKSKIPANSYPDLGADVDTVAITLVLAAMEDLPENQAAQIVSALFESKAEGLSALDNPINQTPEIAVSQLDAEAQTCLHEGSVAYFKGYDIFK